MTLFNRQRFVHRHDDIEKTLAPYILPRIDLTDFTSEKPAIAASYSTTNDSSNPSESEKALTKNIDGGFDNQKSYHDRSQTVQPTDTKWGGKNSDRRSNTRPRIAAVVFSSC